MPTKLLRRRMNALRHVAFRQASWRAHWRALTTQTADSLLNEEVVASALQAHGLSASDEVKDKSARIALLEAFVNLCERPVPSNALSSMRTAADMADFFEGALAPANVQPHAKRMLERRVDVEGVAPIARVETTPDNVRERLMTDLPPNLNIDPATFAPRPTPIMQTARRPAGVPTITKKMRYEMKAKKRMEKRQNVV